MTKRIANAKRLGIIGVGHELRGDDACGCLIIRHLQRQLPPHENQLLIDAGVAPENVIGQLRRFMPDSVLLLDAVDMQQEPGTIALFSESHSFLESIASTHTISLAHLMDYIRIELHCHICLLGVQPLTTAFDAPLSPAVYRTINLICAHLSSILISASDSATKNKI